MASSTATSACPFPPLRRIVTGHTPDGKSTFIHDEQVPSHAIRPGLEKSSLATRLWKTIQSPADNSEKTAHGGDELPDRLGIVSTNGTSLSSFDFAPGGGSPMHRTSSIDYVILIFGELTLVLEDGSERTYSEPGSIIVQRGTLHKWENRGSGWAKFVAVVVDANPVQITDAEGKTVALEEGF